MELCGHWGAEPRTGAALRRAEAASGPQRTPSSQPPFAHRTSGGKALLAALPPNEFARRFPAQGVASLGLTGAEVDRLGRDLEGVRRRGYGVNRGEGERGVAAVGVSVIGAGRNPVGALSISMPTVRLNSARVREMASRLVREGRPRGGTS
jgi:DNA-binding IclR family transcriptional regulator